MGKLSTVGGIAAGAAVAATGGGALAVGGAFLAGKLGLQLAGAIIKAPFKLVGWMFGSSGNANYAAPSGSRMGRY